MNGGIELISPPLTSCTNTAIMPGTLSIVMHLPVALPGSGTLRYVSTLSCPLDLISATRDRLPVPALCLVVEFQPSITRSFPLIFGCERCGCQAHKSDASICDASLSTPCRVCNWDVLYLSPKVFLFQHFYVSFLNPINIWRLTHLQFHKKVYPLLGIIGSAMVLCSTFMVHFTTSSPDIRINKTKRQSVVRVD